MSLALNLLWNELKILDTFSVHREYIIILPWSNIDDISAEKTVEKIIKNFYSVIFD